MAVFDTKYLNQKWTHSFEEDTAQEMVYRPGGYVLRKARGRNQFDLKENGEVVDRRIGKDDVPDPVIGSWKLEGENLVINLSDGSEQVYPLKEVSPEKLVLKKNT